MAVGASRAASAVGDVGEDVVDPHCSEGKGRGNSCLANAIQHLGPLPAVLARLRELAAPGGLLVGDAWTADHFHEFQRARRRSIGCFARPILHAARSQLLPAVQVRRVLREALGPQGQLRTPVGAEFASLSDCQRNRTWLRMAGNRLLYVTQP